MYYNLVSSNLLSGVYFIIIIAYDNSLKAKYNYIQFFWTNSFICKFSSLILHAFILNYTFSHTLLAFNTWLLIKYPLRRKGLTKEQIVYSLSLSWVFTALVLLSSISQTRLPIQCFLFAKSNFFSKPTHVLYFFIQLFMTTSFLVLVYFYLSIIIISRSLMKEKLSSSLKRNVIFTRLVKSYLINLFFSVMITFLYIVIVITIYLRKSDDTALFMISFYTLISSLYSLIIHKQIYLRRKKDVVTNIKLQYIA